LNVATMLPRRAVFSTKSSRGRVRAAQVFLWRNPLQAAGRIVNKQAQTQRDLHLGADRLRQGI
jgi:hypothetical protein